MARVVAPGLWHRTPVWEALVRKSQCNQISAVGHLWSLPPVVPASTVHLSWQFKSKVNLLLICKLFPALLTFSLLFGSSGTSLLLSFSFWSFLFSPLLPQSPYQDLSSCPDPRDCLLQWTPTRVFAGGTRCSVGCGMKTLELQFLFTFISFFKNFDLCDFLRYRIYWYTNIFLMLCKSVCVKWKECEENLLMSFDQKSLDRLYQSTICI